MAMTPAEREELDQVKASIDTIYAQVGMVRHELGYSQQFGPPTQAPISPLRQNLQTALDKIAALEQRPTGASPTLEEIADGLEAEIKAK